MFLSSNFNLFFTRNIIEKNWAVLYSENLVNVCMSTKNLVWCFTKESFWKSYDAFLSVITILSETCILPHFSSVIVLALLHTYNLITFYNSHEQFSNIHLYTFRYSSILENFSDNNSLSAPASGAGVQSYLATTSTSSKVNPQYKTYRSNSQNRILSPTFNNSYHDTNAYATMSRRPERLKRHSSLGSEPSDFQQTSSTSSFASSPIRLDNYVTLHHRRRSDYAPNTTTPSYFYNNSSASPSPMVLSPSNTRQFFTSNNSREGSVTPRFSHSCSNTSLASEPATTAD